MQPPVKFCQTCGSSLVLATGYYRRNCTSCKQLASDDLQALAFGHYVCSGDRADSRQPCDGVQWCVACHYGVSHPVVIRSRIRCTGKPCLTRDREPTVMTCKHCSSPEHMRDPPVPFCWMFDAMKIVARCPLCAFTLMPDILKPGLCRDVPCDGVDNRVTVDASEDLCEFTCETMMLGLPRYTDRRRSRSPTTVKREPRGEEEEEEGRGTTQ